MNTTETKNQIEKEIQLLEQDIFDKKKKLVELRNSQSGNVISDYTFLGPNNSSINLSELFGDKDELILIHNMGKSCPYCTLWADGFNGLTAHLEDRAAFVVVSPDAPEVQQEFAASRGWNFLMYSSKGSTFRKDMGYQNDKHVIPGVSVFKKDKENRLIHFSNAQFGPGDNYCVIWDLIDLLPKGDKEWSPKYVYPDNAKKQVEQKNCCGN